MSRYFFNINDQIDTQGQDIATLAQAKCETVRFAGKLMCDRASNFWDVAHLSISVTNEKGLILFRMEFIGVEAQFR